MAISLKPCIEGEFYRGRPCHVSRGEQLVRAVRLKSSTIILTVHRLHRIFSHLLLCPSIQRPLPETLSFSAQPPLNHHAATAVHRFTGETVCWVLGIQIAYDSSTVRGLGWSLKGKGVGGHWWQEAIVVTVFIIFLTSVRSLLISALRICSSVIRSRLVPDSSRSSMPPPLLPLSEMRRPSQFHTRWVEGGGGCSLCFGSSLFRGGWVGEGWTERDNQRRTESERGKN